MPHLSLLVYNMGDPKKNYEVQYDLCSETDIQLRDNALEAARQAANKYLEKRIPNQYYFFVRVYPHNVIRENKMIAGAGADRLQKGMRAAFGRPTDRAARIRAGQAVFTFKSLAEHRQHIMEAIRRAKAKMSGKYYVNETPIASAAM
jgi:large subunit ribosomal protein L10e